MKKTMEKYTLAAIRTVSTPFFVFSLKQNIIFVLRMLASSDCDATGEHVHAAGSLVQAGGEGEQITISTVCVLLGPRS